MTKPAKKRGVRIPYVMDKLGHRYGRSAIDVQPEPPYVLPICCYGCGCLVGAPHGNADDPDSRSSHYFKREDHKASCKYDLKQRGKDLIEKAPSTVVRLAGQWRLKCPPLQRPGAKGGARGKAGAPARGGSSGGGPAVTSKQRGQAIASARRIVKLLEDFDSDPEVVEQFAAIAPNGRGNIPWDEFCYGPTDAHRLAQHLIDTKQPATSIPHAVWGPASKAETITGNPDTYLVKYVAQEPVLIDGRRVQVRVTLRSSDATWIGAGTNTGMFLGYGYWKLLPKEPADAKGSIELQLWVNEPCSLSSLSVQETERASA